MNRSKPKKNFTTSWEGVKDWYDRHVGEKGHYFHQNVILPKIMPLLGLNTHSKLLDIGCGQGVLARHIPKEVSYLGIDISPSLIQEGKKLALPKQRFIVADATQKITLPEKDFTHACFILSVQNMEDPKSALQLARDHLVKGGKLFLVMNHPAFRIPRQSSWEEDPQNKLLYRRINRYMSSLKIPIQLKPGRESETTYSFHHSLSTLFGWLRDGFAVTALEEWCSDKESTGGRAKSENMAREEFPLFMTIVAQKI